MSKKIYIQILILFTILLIISFVYFIYFTDNKKAIIKSAEGVSENSSINNSDDLITEMKYFSEDNKGNKYEIKSDHGTINPNKSNLISMSKVKAVIKLSNGEKIYINSNQAEYNNDNNDTNFDGSVEMFYNNHKIYAENLDLSFRNNLVTLYNKVNYNNGMSNLIADKILIDFVNKNTKISMNKKENSVLVKSNIKNGDN